MLIISVAHFKEAEPLIDSLELKLLREVKAKQIFANNNVKLVISGMGAINSAIATTLACSTHNSAEPLAVINFGICGAKDTIPVGTLCAAHSIHALSSANNFYPDMLLKLGVDSYSLETRDSFYIKDKHPFLKYDLVDMEASGFYEAALTFIPPSRIFILKIVSDHGNNFSSIKSELPKLLDNNLLKVKEILKRIEEWIQEEKELSSEVSSVLPIITQKLRLTETQYHNIYFLCRARRFKNDAASILTPFISLEYSNRQQRSAVYVELVNALTLS